MISALQSGAAQLVNSWPVLLLADLFIVAMLCFSFRQWEKASVRRQGRCSCRQGGR